MPVPAQSHHADHSSVPDRSSGYGSRPDRRRARRGRGRVRNHADRRCGRRHLLLESLEDRRLLAVSFEMNYFGGNAVGFNDPVRAVEFRSALESAADRLGGWLLDDATIQLDVVSAEFDGTAVAHASSVLPPAPAGGGFTDTLVAAKVKGQADTNGSSADGQLEVFFFDGDDPFTYVTNPAQVDADDELDFQAIMIHELAHVLGFTSATTATGSDDAGDGITSPGNWRPFDQFLSDASGNRLIDADPNSATAYRMDVSASGWPTHSVGGKGPDAGLFFDGPIATSVYGSRVPLYSPAAFSLSSSVSHLDSEGAEVGDSIFHPTTHLLSHATIDRAVPQEFTLLEKAIFADVGIRMVESTLPVLTPPADLTIEANVAGGFAGPDARIDEFLASAVATDLFDDDVTITSDIDTTLTMGVNTIEFTATDDSGNQSTASAQIRVIDTTPPMMDLPGTISLTPNVVDGADVNHPALSGLFASGVAETASPAISFSASPAVIPLGITPVTFTATDGAGNVSEALVMVTVAENHFTVTTLDDELDADPATAPGDLSLREAISLANASAGTDVINFATGLTGDIQLSAALGELLLTDSVAIVGNGSARTTIDAQGESRVIDISDTAGHVVLSGLTLRGGLLTADEAAGAGVRFLASGTLSIDASVIRNNSTAGLAAPGAGVHVLNGDLVMTDSTLTSNVTSGDFSGGAGLWVGRGDLTLRDSTVSGNRTEGDLSFGGGLYLQGGLSTITRSTIAANGASGVRASGAGLSVLNATVVLRDSTVSANAVSGPLSTGGGITALLSDLNVINSTISGNATQTNATDGGGIYADNSTIRVNNSTITGNTANGSGGGIGIDTASQGVSLTIENSIVADNSDAGSAPDLVGTGNVTLVVNHSLIGDNVGTELAESPTRDPVTGNLIGSSSGGGVLDPRLDPLGDHGGPTATHPLQSDSPAIDAGDPLFNLESIDPPIDHDQRGEGFARISGSAIDIGAFESTGSVTLNWGNPADLMFGTPLGSEQLNATADVPGTFVYSPAAGSVLGVGENQPLSVIFTPFDTGTYDVTEATVFIDVVRADPVITWAPPESIAFGVALDATQLNATANVAGTFEYSPEAGTVLNAGDDQLLNVTFTPTDIANYNVVSATVSIDVMPGVPVISWDDPSPIVFGTALSNVELDATANMPGRFNYVPPRGIFLPAGNNQTLFVTFIPDDIDNFAVVSTSVSIDVLKATPIVTWADPAPIAVGTPLGSEQLNATSDQLGSFAYTPTAGTLLDVGTDQTLSTTFTPTDSGNYSTVTVDVSIDVIDAKDYGDAPAGYPVTLAQDGARHALSSLLLGASSDAETDGVPSAAADTDGADDDGVTLVATPVADATSSTTASFAVVASESGKLDAWIDFNGDGDWDDSGEQIATSLDVSAGANLLTYVVPAGSTPGQTAARFRISSAGGLSPTGQAEDGEVEDYLVTLEDAAGPASVALSPYAGEVELSFDGDTLRGTAAGQVVFETPRAAVGQVEVVGTLADEKVTLESIDEAVMPAIDVRGNGGDDTLELLGTAVFDFSATGNQVSDIATIDLQGTGATELALDAETVDSLSPVDQSILIQGDATDSITVADAADWLMTAPLSINGRFIRTATHTDGQVIQYESPNDWQNFVRISDINNDGLVTARDALRVINELGRRNFSDRETRELNPALTTLPWPDVYFDQNADDRVSALDALRVINELARISLANEEGEWIENATGFHSIAHVPLSATEADSGETAEATVPSVVEVRSGRFETPQFTLKQSGAATVAAAEGATEGPVADAVDSLLADVSFLTDLAD